MRDPERLARQPVEKVARDRLPRGVRDGVHQAVEPVPALGEAREQPVDLLVGRDVAGKDDVAAELGGHLRDALLEAVVLVGERERRAFAAAGARDPVGDRTVAEDAGDQDALVVEKAHSAAPSSRDYRGWLPGGDAASGDAA